MGTNKEIDKIEKKMKELLILCNKENIWGWNKRFEIGEVHKEVGFSCGFHVGEFTKRCVCCNQPLLDEGLNDLDDEQELKKLNCGRSSENR